MGCVLLFIFKRMMDQLQKDVVRRQHANRMLTLMRHYPFMQSHEIQQQVAHKINEEDDDNTMTNDVFQRPLALVTSLLVKPLERNFVDSLDRFLLGRVMHADGTPLESIADMATKAGRMGATWALRYVGVSGGKKPSSSSTLAPTAADDGHLSARERTHIGPMGSHFIYLRELFRRYEHFCLENDLLIIADRAAIQRAA